MQQERAYDDCANLTTTKHEKDQSERASMKKKKRKKIYPKVTGWVDEKVWCVATN